MLNDILRVDFDFYTNEYKGTATEEAIADALEQAAIQVYVATYCRTKAAKLSPYQTDMAKLAICFQADSIAAKGSEVDMSELVGVTGYTIGDVSISFDAATTAKASQDMICGKARGYLLPTGLLNRCLS